jgi:two-component system, NarL family, sensor histidine kinase BarA
VIGQLPEHERALVLREVLDLRTFQDVCKSFVGIHQVGLQIFDGSNERVLELRGALGMQSIDRPIEYQGETLGRVVIGPFSPAMPPQACARLADHFIALLDGFMHQGHKYFLASTIHFASVNESHHELEEKNRQLESALEHLKEVDRLKSTFLATMSHELRTPLTSIIGYSEMLLEGIGGALSPEQKDYVSAIMDKGESLLQIIVSLLDVSKMEAGRAPLTLSDEHLGSIIQDSVSTLLPHARRKSIDVRCTAENLPRLRCDGPKIRQCVINLLSNAIKFTPTNGTVRISAEVDANFAVVRVSDTGIGIAPEFQQRLFQTFFQVDNSMTREYGGAGLGLSIVKNVVEAHDGEVRVESELGKGATFTMILPARGPRA